MIQTLIDSGIHFTHIAQIADIHIRLTKRHDEYREVFSKLYKELEDTPAGTVICVLGDVIHNKVDLSPECVQLTSEFLETLADIHPTVLVAGNHDTNLANRNRMDSLSPIVNAINHPNLYYLKKSGLYEMGNICINNYGIFDSPNKYIKGEDIPKTYRNKYKHFVVLYHGPVNDAMTDIGFRIINKAVPVSLFDHHDIALLGDIHMRQDLQQYSSEHPVVHYCGSLIQQNHGEALTEHGFTLWDLKTEEYRCINIPNNYGFFTVVMDKGKVITDVANIPKKARVQFQLFETVPTEVKSALSKLRETAEVIETSFSKLESDATVKAKSISPTGIVLGNITNRDYQVTLLTDYLKTKLIITDQSIIDKVIAINDATNASIKRDDFARNIRWIPIRFEWDNLFSFGEGNVIDFTKMKDVVGLFAPNASGKSTILSALSFCIFDKCDREFKASNILNVQKTGFKCKLEFELDGKKYFIERTGKADRKGAVKVNVRFWTLENGKEVDLHGEARRDTNEVIRDYLGTYEDFILTSLSIQNGKNNGSVIDMGDTGRKDLLAQFMGLSIFDRLYNEANERFKELTTLLKSHNEDYTKKLVDFNNFLSQAENLQSQQKTELEELDKRKKTINQFILDENLKLIKIDVDVPSDEVSQKKKEEAEKQMGLVKAEIEPTEKKIVELTDTIAVVEKIVKDAEAKDTTKNYFKHQELVKQKVQLQNDLKLSETSTRHSNEIIERTKEHQYDPNCKFCVTNASKFITDRENATKKLEGLKKSEDVIKAKIELVQVEIDKLEWTQEAVALHQTSFAKWNSTSDLRIRTKDRLSVLQKTLTDFEVTIKKCNDDIDIYNKNVEAIKTNNTIYKRIASFKHDLVDVEYAYKTKNNSVTDLNGKISVAKNQIENINKKIEEAKKVESEHKLYEIYTKAVSRDGIPFNVITMTVPEIEREVNTILSQIAEFSSKFETDGKNVVPYIVYDDKKWLMSLTSGMEKFTLSLAIRVALINISNLPRPNFLVIDEGFGVLDAENLAAMSTLFSFLKSNFEFIMIVSHLDALRDMVDKHIEITKENGFSKVNFV